MEKSKYLILLAGSPGTGKTYLMNMLKEKFEDMYIITPDEIKEDYAEKYGFNNLSEKEELEKSKVWPFYYKALDLYMEVGKRVIATEYPFSYKQKDILEKMSKEYGYKVITIRLGADFETLWQRRYIRDREDDRHLSHIMSDYHYGDTLKNRENATNHITKDGFQKIISDRGYDDFELGELFKFDVTDYAKVDYKPLIEYLDIMINSE